MSRHQTYKSMHITIRAVLPSLPAQAPYVYCTDNPIKLVVDRNIVLAIMLSFVFGVGYFPLFGQNERDLSRMDAQKYRIKGPSLFDEDTNSFIKVSDALLCQEEMAEINQHTIACIQGYENQRNAYRASFALTLWDWCRETGQSQHVFMNEIGDSTIEIGVRCYSDSRTFLGKEVTANSLHGECLTTCSGEKIGKDSILTMIYTFPQDIHVARLYQFGHRCYLLPLDVEMDECGIYILRIPTNEEGVYTFYNTPNYVCLIRFFPRKNNQNESPGILIR